MRLPQASSAVVRGTAPKTDTKPVMKLDRDNGRLAMERNNTLYVKGTKPTDQIGIHRGEDGKGPHEVSFNGKPFHTTSRPIDRVVVDARGGRNAIDLGRGVDDAWLNTKDGMARIGGAQANGPARRDSSAHNSTALKYMSKNRAT